MTSLCLVVQLADRTSILSKGSFSVIMIDISLFSNHSPSEWFSLYKKARSFVLRAGKGRGGLPERSRGQVQPARASWMEVRTASESSQQTSTTSPEGTVVTVAALAISYWSAR